MIDLKKMSDADLAYLEGFVNKCAAAGVDPEALLSKIAEPDGKADEPEEQVTDKATPSDSKPKGPGMVKKVVGGAGKGGLAGAAVGGVLGAGAAGAAVAKPVMKAMGAPTGKVAVLKTALEAILKGGAGGAAMGAGAGAMTGAAVRAVS